MTMQKEKPLVLLKSHDAVMVCISLDEKLFAIKSARRLVKRSAGPDTPAGAVKAEDRYYHGYEEGLQYALRMIKEKFGVE